MCVCLVPCGSCVVRVVCDGGQFGLGACVFLLVVSCVLMVVCLCVLGVWCVCGGLVGLG